MRNYDYIALLSLEWGGEWGVGENDNRSYLNRKCRTLEYSLNARSFTLAGFGKESFITFVKYISKKYRRLYNNTTVFRL